MSPLIEISHDEVSVIEIPHDEGSVIEICLHLSLEFDYREERIAQLLLACI